MEYAYIELLLVREMGYTGDERLLERPIIGPFGKRSVDVGVVNVRLPGGTFRDGQALPRHPRIQHPQNEVKEAMIADFAPWTALGHREVREDKCGELGFRQLYRDGRCFRIFASCAHHRRALCEEF
ncbi:MAG: hypothetical protein M3120_04110 [Pseudomonadota bacterium]|nr:hypothetical protein [Pseudomonadota bacterium]